MPTTRSASSAAAAQQAKGKVVKKNFKLKKVAFLDERNRNSKNAKNETTVKATQTASHPPGILHLPRTRRAAVLAAESPKIGQRRMRQANIYPANNNAMEIDQADRIEGQIVLPILRNRMTEVRQSARQNSHARHFFPADNSEPSMEPNRTATFTSTSLRALLTTPALHTDPVATNTTHVVQSNVAKPNTAKKSNGKPLKKVANNNTNHLQANGLSPPVGTIQTRSRAREGVDKKIQPRKANLRMKTKSNI